MFDYIVKCAACNFSLQDQPREIGRPCPQCGSLARFQFKEDGKSAAPEGSKQPEIEKYPQIILDMAHHYYQDKFYGIAVVTAHTACEIAAERTLAAALSNNGQAGIKDAVMNIFNGSSLKNRNILNLYKVLTNDHIDKTSFWVAFTDSAGLRKDVIQGKKTASRMQAEKSLETARSLVSHLKSVREKLGS